jgi:hypothetical protein
MIKRLLQNYGILCKVPSNAEANNRTVPTDTRELWRVLQSFGWGGYDDYYYYYYYYY